MSVAKLDNHTAAPPARPRRRMRASVMRATIVSIILIPICLLWIYPLLWMVSASLKTNAEIFGGLSLLPAEPQWQNYTRAWEQARIGQYFLNTVVITVSSVILVVVVTSMIGFVLGRYAFPGKRAIIALFVATVFLPTGYTIIPLFEMVNRLGLADTLWGVILAQSGGAHVLYILLFAGYFSQLPRELEEAAIMDGAGFVRVFAQVMLPLATPIMATVVILQFINSWNDFLLPLVLTLSRPDLRTLAVGMYAFRGEYYVDWSGMAAAASISLLPVILVFLFMQRYFVEGIAGAVKQ
ncbi:MAG: carbohydrate ABC transporter permease [Caldilinea sp.]|nr:carbohydrate ABC transporter permease [Caldilinea sp.]MCB0134864.1 carbohydrate ABC transporter permease [Caldilineaceae bacterium]MCB0048530.1 carbohydrate ABC transporter permease [Caldilinea sp.]MCB0148513.1 carbohydrate ABC transporter permease [Caldilineaceae bacterium]MCB9114063.1 carbohydrate ABC transporter permease [Caldilineaceae bacterium]